MIAFIGSVFSPYYAHARRRNPAADPEHHVALNVALYGAGGPGWSMTERGRRALRRDAATLTIGPSRMAWNGAFLQVDIDEWAVPLPRRLRGRITLHPAALHAATTALDDRGAHRWTPIAPCARIDVDMESPCWRWQGHGYGDSNDGDARLEDSFRTWDWSRVNQHDGSTTVLYDAVRNDGSRVELARRFTPDGDCMNAAMPPRQPVGRGRWGLRRSAHGDAPPRLLRRYEDSPFYTRSLLAVTLGGETAPAMHESLSLTAFNRRWVQAMLPFRMPRSARRWHQAD